MIRDAFVGIDVAFSKHKRLPVCVCIRERNRPRPLALRRHKDLLPPKGEGYRRIVDPAAVATFATQTLHYLQAVAAREALIIRNVAIDAPSAYKHEHSHRRACEQALDTLGIRYYPTPSEAEFAAITEKVRRHFQSGGAENRVPHANQLWMLAGFALFQVLGRHYRCLEVYPQAIVHQLSRAGHKSKPKGLADQLMAVAAATGWSATQLHAMLAGMGYGAAHDRLDAYMAAWVASLPLPSLKPCGHPPDDVIWLPPI